MSDMGVLPMPNYHPEARRYRLDKTDHARFIDENRDYLRKERADRLFEKIRDLERAARHRPNDRDLQRDIENAREELRELGGRQ